MPSPSPEIIQLLSVFSIVFTAPTFAKVMILIFGTILAPGRRTVTAALRMMGLGDNQHYSKYHRVLNRDRWSSWLVSKILLSLIISIFIPAGHPCSWRSMKRWNGGEASRSSTKVGFETRFCQPRSMWSNRWAFVGFVWRYWYACPGVNVRGHCPS